MDPKINELYNDEILAEVSTRFEINVDALTALDGFESYIYSYEKNGKGYILRVGHSSHRDANAVQGEAEFIDYLGANGINVGRPVRDANGNLVEAIPAEEGEFVAVVFEKVPGEEPDDHVWDDGTLMKKLGRMLAKMHVLTQEFEPSAEQYRRLDWDEDNEIVMGLMHKGLPEDEAAEVAQRYQALVDQVNELPRTKEHFGLVHFDVHDGNFFLHRGEIQLFDFDDCLYTWFANDIAMVIYYATSEIRDDAEQLKFQITQFIEGYNEISTFNPLWLEYIPAFLMMRRWDLYARVHTDFITEEWDEWVTQFINQIREKQLIGKQPILVLDFKELTA